MFGEIVPFYGHVPFKCSRDTSLEWFQYNILNHILPTNSRFVKKGITAMMLAAIVQLNQKRLRISFPIVAG